MSDNHSIYMVGIKGAGMASLAVYLKERGKSVWGSDVQDVFPTDSLINDNDIRILDGFNKENVTQDIDLVITTGAHGGLRNVEVVEAKRMGISVMTHAEEVGHIMESYDISVSVCGSHGKTTTAAMLAYTLRQLNKKSSHVIGTPSFSGLSGGSYGGLDYFVAEADEYVNSLGSDNTPRFMFQNPTHIICTNIDYDHPDVYKSVNELEKAYASFFKKLNMNNGYLVYNGEDKRLMKIAGDVKNAIPYYGRDSDIHLSVPGMHNISNATAVRRLCELLGFKDDLVLSALASFQGSKRRFESIYTADDDDIFFIDDYAHHPTELQALVKAARERYKDRRIVLIFQPHTYSRTKALEKDFVDALLQPDITLVLDIFGSARESEGGITSADLVESANNKNDNHGVVSYLKNKDLKNKLSKLIKRGDIIISAGAGDIYKLHPIITQSIKQYEHTSRT